jgi:hypothetical protein
VSGLLPVCSLALLLGGGGDSYDAEVARTKRQVAPAVRAFEQRDQAALRRWVTKVRPASLRTYGWFLLVKLGDAEARRAFVDAFPVGGGAEFSRLDDIGQATCPGEACFRGQADLICAALDDWEHARAQLFRLRPNTDAGAHTESCCGLALIAAHAPTDFLPTIVRAALQKDLGHAFENEASPEVARRMLEHLEATDYRGTPVAKLREALLPILRKKAGARWTPGLGPCDWITCPGR